MPCTNKDKQKSSLKYYLLEPATFKLDGGAMYGIIPKPLWQKNHPADELNRVDLALRLWVIETPEKLIVVDTGIGDYHDEKFNRLFDVKSDKNPIEQALNKLGKSCAEVSDLVITHLHFDHVGGIGVLEKDSWIPTFKNATLHLHVAHLEYSKNCTPRDKGSFHTQNFLPIIDIYKESSRLELYSGEEGELFKLDSNTGEVLKFKCSHGHTPWLMHPFTDKLIYLADLVPTSNHIPTAWVMGYDISPGITTADKEKMLKFIKENDLTMIFEHDPKFWGSKLAMNERGRLIASEPREKEEALAYKVSLS